MQTGDGFNLHRRCGPSTSNSSACRGSIASPAPRLGIFLAAEQTIPAQKDDATWRVLHRVTPPKRALPTSNSVLIGLVALIPTFHLS